MIASIRPRSFLKTARSSHSVSFTAGSVCCGESRRLCKLPSRIQLTGGSRAIEISQNRHGACFPNMNYYMSAYYLLTAVYCVVGCAASRRAERAAAEELPSPAAAAAATHRVHR